MGIAFPPELLKTGRVREQRELALGVLTAALEAVDPVTAVRRHLLLEGEQLSVDGQAYDLRRFARVLVVGAGKASGAMAAEVEQILGERITAGVINVPQGYAASTQRVAQLETGHPLPDEAGVAGTRRMVELLGGTTDRDLVLCLLSGGGSALMTLPQDEISLDDLQQLTQALLRSGATIAEINVVRKHLDRVKGGGLARLAQPAPVVSLILSDVVGSPLETIASGPTAPDPTTYADAIQVIERYGLWQTLRERVARRLLLGSAGKAPETAKPGDALFERVQNVVVGSNEVAARAAVAEAERRRLRSLLLSTYVEGEAREVGKVFAALARELAAADRPLPRPACLVAGGETTVTVQGQGLGGRNQELALGAALKLVGLSDVLVVSAATDGRDGPTDAAGALADGSTIARGREQGLDAYAALANNDAYHYFEPLGDLLKTGPTHTNVNDLVLVFAF